MTFSRRHFSRRENGPAAGRRALQRTFNPPCEPLERRTFLSAPGDLDPSFSGDGKLTQLDSPAARGFSELAVAPGGKLVMVGGQTAASGGPAGVLVSRFNADGSLDTTFGSGGRVVTPIAGAAGTHVAVRSDGKIVVGAYVQPDVVQNPRSALIRYNANGSLDTSFGGGDGVAEINSVPDHPLGFLSDLALAPGDKVVITLLTQRDLGAARFNADGSPDTSFNGDGFAFVEAGFHESAESVAVAADGSVFVAGSADTSESVHAAHSVLLKLTPGGAPDAAFGGGDGLLHGTLNFPGTEYSGATDLDFAPGGKLVVAGSSNNFLAVARLDPATGAFDNSFSGDGRAFVTPGEVGPRPQIAIQPDGKVVATVQARTPGGQRAATDFYVWRLETDGDADPTWNNGGPAVVDFFRAWDSSTSIAVQGDGRVVALGHSESATNEDLGTAVAARFTTAGRLDTTFSGDGKWSEPFGQVLRRVAATAVQSDGKTIVAGTMTRASSLSPTGLSDDFFLTRYNADGSLDRSFGTGGTVVRDVFAGQFDVLSDVLVQPNGKILAVGKTAGFGRQGDVAIVRLNANGTMDTTFSGDGKLAQGLGGDDEGVELALRSDGDILVSAISSEPARQNVLLRYNPDGSLDAALDGDGILGHAFGTQIAVQADNKVLIAGSEYLGGAPGQEERKITVRRLNTNGELDATYGEGGRAAGGFSPGDELYAVDLVLQNGKALVLADADIDSLSGSSHTFPALLRFTTGGTLDNTFGGGDGKEFFAENPAELRSDRPRAMALEANNRILVATEYARHANDADTQARGLDFSVLRFTPDGQRDATFGTNGRVVTDFDRPRADFESSHEVVRDLAAAPGGRVVAVGDVIGDLGGPTGYAVARYLGDGVAVEPLPPGVEIVNGVLRVNGTAGGDDIRTVDLGPAQQKFNVTVNGKSATLNRALFSRVEIIGNGGDDRLAATPHPVLAGGADYADLPMLLNGGEGADELHGGSGNDRLLGMAGNDRLFGFGGDDVVDGGLGTDVQDGGAGADTVDYSFRNSAVFVDLDGLADDGPAGENDLVAANVEHILGGGGADTLSGNGANNFIRGNGGNDTVRGGGGNDTLVGDGGQDKLYGDDGDDFLDARDGITDLVLDGGIGTDKAKKDAADPQTSIEQLQA